MDNTPILELRKLSYAYSPDTPMQHRALQEIDLTIHAGEFIGIIGHTGSGKSTLIQHLNGLLKPTGGQILYRGEDIHKKGYNLRALRSKVGLVFQYPEYQLFEETVAADIAFGPKNMDLSEEEVQQRVRRAAAFVGLPEDLLQASPFALSGGQKRRVAIAGVIAMQPEVLILDEPTAGLDPGGSQQLMEQLEQYRQATGAAIIVVTHNMEAIAAAAGRLLVLKAGSIVMDGAPEVIFAEPENLTDLGLDVPQITRVFMHLEERGVTLDTAVYTLPYALRKLCARFGVEPPDDGRKGVRSC